MRNFLFCIFIIAGISSCSFYQIDSEIASGKIYPAKSSAEEVVYIANLNNIKEPCEIIGQVTINVERRQSLEEIIPKMKQEAALLGGDAITDIRINAGTGRWAKIKPKKIFGNANIRSNYVANVIVFQATPAIKESGF